MLEATAYATATTRQMVGPKIRDDDTDDTATPQLDNATPQIFIFIKWAVQNETFSLFHMSFGYCDKPYKRQTS